MILFGASGHGKVVQSASNKTVILYFDDDESKSEFNGLSVKRYDFKISLTEEIVITIGDNQIRKTISQKIKHNFGKVISSYAIVDQNVSIGRGSQILHNSVIQSDTVIGKHCIINTSASVDHDCVIEDFVHIAPNATLCGNIFVGEGSLIGAAAVILPGVKVGRWCKIGAGSVVTKDVEDFAVMVGSPARKLK